MQLPDSTKEAFITFRMTAVDVGKGGDVNMVAAATQRQGACTLSKNVVVVQT